MEQLQQLKKEKEKGKLVYKSKNDPQDDPEALELKRIQEQLDEMLGIKRPQPVSEDSKKKKKPKKRAASSSHGKKDKLKIQPTLSFNLFNYLQPE
jgi:hypothetical protein